MTRPFPTTSLTKFANSMRDPDPAASREACRRAFHDEDVLCVRLDDDTSRRIGWANMQMLRNIGAIIYGKPKK